MESYLSGQAREHGVGNEATKLATLGLGVIGADKLGQPMCRENTARRGDGVVGSGKAPFL